jgi:photosystem I subunit 3
VGKVVCSAQEENKQLSTALAAAALAAVVGFGQVDAAKADISGLTPCSESKAYQKRLKNELKALQKRAKQVRMQEIGIEPDTPICQRLTQRSF